MTGIKHALEHERIWSLEDGALVEEVAKLEVALLPPTQFATAVPTLSDWEKTFIAGVQPAWVRYGSLSWKQRKHVREILLKVWERRERQLQLDKKRARYAGR